MVDGNYGMDNHHLGEADGKYGTDNHSLEADENYGIENCLGNMEMEECWREVVLKFLREVKAMEQ